jgi:hypothetical protein
MAIVTSNTNLTGVSYTAGEIIEIRNGATLTIDSTPATRPGTIQCITSGKLRIENSSTSTPIVLELEDNTRDLRFEGNGILEIRGNKIEIGTGTGASQTFDFATLFSGALTDVTYVEVETASGSNEYMPWHIFDVTPAYYNANFATNISTIGSTAATQVDGTQPVFFWDSLLRTLTSGDGTNGLSVPSGCKIRIPNILITNQDWQPDVCFVHGLSSFGTPTGGTFTITLINRRTSTTVGTTGAIAFNATAATIDTAVEAVLGAGTITSTGGPLPTAVTLTLAGAYASTPIAMLITSSVTGGTNSIIQSRENATTNMSLLDLNPSGTLDAEWCSFSQKIRAVNASFSNAICKQVGFGGDNLRFFDSNGSVDIDSVSYKASPYVVQTSTAISNISGANTKINKFVISGGPPAHSIATIPNLTQCDDVRVLTYIMRQSTSAILAMSINTIPNIPIVRPRIIGGTLRLTNLFGNVISNFSHADRPLTQTTLNPAVACGLVNCVNVTLAYTEKAGVAATRGAVFSADSACSNILAVGGSYDMTNHGAGVIGQQLGAIFETKNFTVTNSRTAIQSFDAPTSFACTGMSGRKVFIGGGQAAPPTLDSNQDGQYDLVGCALQNLIQANVSVQNFVGGNFVDLGTTPTTGHVSFFAFGSGQGMALTGSAFTDQIGSVFLPSSGDTAEITMPFAMHGITSFQNVTPRFLGECPGGFARAARILNDGGVTGGTFTISIYDATNTLLGTTTAIAWNASTTTIDTAIEVVTGAGSVTVSGSLTAGYVITFLTGVIRRVEGDGASLTGGTKAGTMDSYARYTVTEDNEVFPGIEFACRVPGTTYPAYQALNGTNLSGAIAALTGYSEGGSGLEMKLLVTATGNAEFRRLQQCSLRTNVDPDAWDVFDSFITFNGPNPTDVIRIRRLADLGASPPINLYSFTGGGLHNFDVAANFGEEVFFVREDSVGTVLMRSLPFTQFLGYGNLGEVNLFYGEEVQLAQSSQVAEIKAKVDAYLDVAISSRLAASAYVTPDNTSITAIKAKTDNLPANPASVSDIPTAVQVADTVLRRSTANVEASGTGDAISLKSLYGMVAQGVHNTQVSGATLTVTQSDDATVLGTRTVTTDPSAEPIVGIDSD